MNKKDIVKNVIIVILVLIILVLVSLYLLNPDYSTESTNLIQSAFESQLNLSEYIGKMRSDTFDAYSTQQLIIGSYNLEDPQNSLIMDTTGAEILSIVYSTPEDIIEKDGIKYYRVNMTNLTSIIKVQLLSDSNIVWYLSENGVLKCTYKHKPKWWVDELEVFHL